MPDPSSKSQVMETDLLIIGSGMAGMAAALFAAKKNIGAVLTGAAGGFEYASGLMDLWGLSLTRENHLTFKPWDMLEILKDKAPEHPLARIDRETITQGFDTMIQALGSAGLSYTGYPVLNHTVLTPFGTRRMTFRLPRSMKANSKAFKEKPACLVLDFKGLREFSARFFCEMLQKKWPKITPGLIEFPQTRLRAELFTPFMAQQMETEQVQDALIKKIKPQVKGKQALGLPAMLGIQSADRIRERLEDKLNLSVFEIPTSPVSVPGMRLKEALGRSLINTSVKRLSNKKVTRIIHADETGFEAEIASLPENFQVRSKAVILASGRFLSKGLLADRDKIVEPLFDLPVAQPESRSRWHQQTYFDAKGHAVNRAGIETDHNFRPVDKSGRPLYPNLFAAGSILAHQDWARTKCGTALAVATAFKAVETLFGPKVTI